MPLKLDWDRYAKELADQEGSSDANQPPTEENHAKWPYMAVAGAHAADVATTLYNLHHGAVEANPFMGGGDPKVMIPAKVGVGLLTSWLVHELQKSGHPTAAKWAGAVGAAPPAAAAIHNAILGR